MSSSDMLFKQSDELIVCADCGIPSTEFPNVEDTWGMRLVDNPHGPRGTFLAVCPQCKQVGDGPYRKPSELSPKAERLLDLLWKVTE